MRAFGRLIFFQKIHFLRVQKNCLGCGYRDFLAENPVARCPRTLPPRPTAPWDPAPAAIRWVSGASGTANKEKQLLSHVLFLRTSTICLIFPGCCRMSSISSVVLRCRGVCAAAAGMRAASGCCVCLCSAGIHRRAVGLLMFNSLAQAETEPPGCCWYHSCTRACCVGAPARLMRGSPSVNLVIVSPPIVILPRRSPSVQIFSSNFPVICHVK